MTYLPTAQGWLSLAVILALYSPIVVGWSMSARCEEELVGRALDLALARRPQAGLLHHRDRGSQDTSRAYRLSVEPSGIMVSRSGKGNCWDKAARESFFGSWKEEGVGTTIYASHGEARQARFLSLEGYYHRIRRHSTRGYVSPLV